MNKIKVSVIIPVYNTELYLNQCIDSILSQSFSDYELILVDDGSTDRSADICKAYVSRDARIKYFYQNNSGASVARNLGIEACEGEYITFVDSDDWIDCDYLESMVNSIDGYDIVQIGNHVYTSDGTINRGDQNNELLPFEIEGYELCRALLEGKYQTGGVPWGKLYRRELWESERFPNMQRFEDVAVLYKIYWHAKKVRFLKTGKYCYRSQRPGSIMHSPFSLKWLEIIDVEEERVKFFKEKSEWDLYALAKFNLMNQLIYIIKMLKEKTPNEKDTIKQMQSKLWHEVIEQITLKGYCEKKIKILIKSVGVLI